MAAPVPYQTFSYLDWNASTAGELAAVWDAGEEISFAELRDLVLGAAGALGALGVRQGSVVGLRLPNVWQYVALELAISYLGAVIMPLPLALGDHELRFLLGRTQATPVIFAPEGGTAPPGASAVPAGEIFEGAASRRSVPPPARVGPEAVHEIALTSGSTGVPKLASLTAELKQVTFEGFTSRLAIGRGDRVLAISPLAQGIGGMCLYCLRAGATLVLPGGGRWTPEHTLDVVRVAHPTVLVGVPTNVIRMLSSPRFEPADLATARTTAVAGAPMPPEVSERWETLTGSMVCVFYGSMDAGQLAVASPTDPRLKRWTTVGRPHDRARWCILDAAGRALPAGEVGEICMAGPLVQSRYWGEERGPYSEDGWAHMGDLGMVDTEGFLHVVGRLKDIVIRGGANINPYEVESVLRGHPQVLDACVVGRPHPELGEVPVAFIVVRAEPAGLPDSVRAYLDDRGLARYKWPEELRIVGELPVSGPGKVDRRLLRELSGQPVEGGARALPLR
jgi:acyl-CoA synthetase (AMP-forming)/AMP-acid ligase II